MRILSSQKIVQSTIFSSKTLYVFSEKKCCPNLYSKARADAENNQFNRPSETTGCSSITNNGSHHIDDGGNQYESDVELSVVYAPGIPATYSLLKGKISLHYSVKTPSKNLLGKFWALAHSFLANDIGVFLAIGSPVAASLPFLSPGRQQNAPLTIAPAPSAEPESPHTAHDHSGSIRGKWSYGNTQ